jgi:dTDP-glucose 4,6-dehydratase
MHVLVTGGSGFIGSCYVRSLLSDRRPGPEVSRVVVLDALTYAGNRSNLDPVAADPRFEFVHGDIRDRDLLDRLLPGVDVVVNFAAETHVDRSIADPTAFLGTNVVGAATLFEACLRAQTARVLHVSTDEVYGSLESGSWTEQSPLLPNSPYSAAKASGDLFARAYFRTYGLPVIVTRCSNNYGPYQYPEKVIPLFVTNLIDGLPVPLYGDGGNVRDWLHVLDHCRGIDVALAHGLPGEVYNIGGGTELTNRELTGKVLELMGAGWDQVTPVPDRLGHDRRYSVDDTALRGLGYKPAYDLVTGLAETVAWYRDHPDWWRPLVRR